MRERKTIKVTELVDAANHILEYSDDDLVADRRAVAHLTLKLLMDAGAYKGFNYLPSAGLTPNGKGYYAVDIADDSRVRFYGGTNNV